MVLGTVAGAQYSLGLIYRDGDGVPQNDAEAVVWFLKAAEQGLVEAQYNLGWMYAKGQGVPPHYVNAYMLASLAAVAGSGLSIALREGLLEEMTPAQIERGQTLSSSWQEGTSLPLE